MGCVKLLVRKAVCHRLFFSFQGNSLEFLDDSGDDSDDDMLFAVNVKKYEAFFVDCGFTTVLSSLDLAPLPKKFLERLPLQAVHCQLHNVQANPEVPRNQTVEKLQHLCLYDEATMTNNSFARSVTLDVVSADTGPQGVVYDVTFAMPEDSLPVQTSLLDSGLASLIDE